MTDNTGFLTIILYIMLAGMFVLAVAFAFVYMNMKFKEKKRKAYSKLVRVCFFVFVAPCC